MPWFICDDCGESIKKPKVAAHSGRCSASSFTCIDCSLVFHPRSVHGHTQCVTEHEKYAQGATKPGGYAENGFVAAPGQQQAGAAAGEIVGAEFLTKGAPWKCVLCDVNCTGYENLVAHAQGAKHKRKSRAAIASRDAGGAPPKEPAGNTEATEEPVVAANGEGPLPSHNGNGAAKINIAASPGKPPKWKKLAATELKKSGGAMKLKKLLAAIAKAAGREGSDSALEKLQGSSKFSIEGKTISLTGADN